MKALQYTICILSTFIGLQSCTKKFETLNTNPVGIEDINPAYQLTKIQTGLSGDREDVWKYDLGIASPLVQHLGGAWWTRHGGMYQILEKNHWYSHWETVYARELTNIQDIINKTSGDANLVNMNATSRILRVYIFSRLTDMYGDIPYFDAVKGYPNRIYRPKYDKQEDIYQDFFKELKESVEQLDENQKKIEGDLFYSGDVAKWKRFASSLHLRLGFRLTKVNLSEAKKQVEHALASGVMGSNQDICMMKHMNISYRDDELRGNGRSQVFKNEPISGGFRLVKTLVDYMKNAQDPRLHIYGGTYLGDGIIGMSSNITDISKFIEPLGVVPGAVAWSQWADYGNITDDKGNSIFVGHNLKFLQPSIYVSALDAPFFHLTYAEVEFLKAEAAARGWAGLSNAENHFMKGIQASCEMMGFYPDAPSISQQEIDLLKNSFTPFPTAFEEQMEHIHSQMWVNFFLNGAEAYANYRRTGYPNLVPFTAVDSYTSGTGGVMPRRFFYPESEAIQNKQNLEEALTRIGGRNDWLKRVWWDK